MSERLSDELVACLAHPFYEDRFLTEHELTLAALAREVQERRDKDWADDLTHLKMSADMLAVRDLCTRHGITVSDIVALVELVRISEEAGLHEAQEQARAPRQRHEACVEAWPECREGDYDPRCCRFPKSCSCEIFEPPTEAFTAPGADLATTMASLRDRLADLHATAAQLTVENNALRQQIADARNALR